MLGHVHTWGNPANLAVVCLHGFMQTGASWESVAQEWARRYFVVAPDLIGHGSNVVDPLPQNFTLDAYCAQVAQVIAWCKDQGCASVVLVGYSMGGRIAATYAARTQCAGIRALVLESAGLGPASEEQRAVRAQKSEASIVRLEASTFEDFVSFWEALPLFVSQRALPEDVQARVRAERLANDPAQLVLNLRHAGQQCMENLRGALTHIPVPALYVAGAHDVTYTEIAHELERSLAGSAQNKGGLQVQVVAGLGHNIHLENPQEFTHIVQSFLAPLAL